MARNLLPIIDSMPGLVRLPYSTRHSSKGAFLVLPGILSSLFVVLLGQASTPSAADWQWFDQHRTEAFEAFMPTQDSTTALVTYRSYRDLYHEVEEQYFSYPWGLCQSGVAMSCRSVWTVRRISIEGERSSPRPHKSPHSVCNERLQDNLRRLTTSHLGTGTQGFEPR